MPTVKMSVAEIRTINGYRKDLIKEFSRQGRETDKMLRKRDAYTELYAYAQKAHPELYAEEKRLREVEDIEKTKNQDLKKIDTYLYDWAAEVNAQKFRKVSMPWIVKAGVIGGQAALKNMGATGVVFNLRNKSMLDVLLERGAKITGEVSKNTLKDFRKILYDSYMEVGSSPLEVRSRIDGLFEETYKNRSLTIARTETAIAQSTVSQETYQRNGIKKKRWIAHMDDKTRFSHANVTKEPIPFDEDFELTDEEGRVTYMPWSNDPNGPASEVINCRCSVVGVTDLSKPFEPDWTGE